MKKSIIVIILLILILISGFWIVKIIFLDTANDKINPLNTSLIETQRFIIDTQKDTIVIGEKGTLIRIKKNSFTDCIGNLIEGKVQLELKEIYSNADIILSGLTTTSNGKTLESGGMLYINATKNKKSVCINDTLSIGIIAPVENYNGDMMLFSGVKDNENKINWVNPTPFIDDNPKGIRAIGSIPDSLTENEAIKLGIISRDTTFYIGETDLGVLSFVSDSSSFFEEYLKNHKDEFELEEKIHAVFSINNFGYYNIDSFIYAFQTDNIKFSTIIKNAKDFNKIYVKLAFKNKNVYLGSFSLNNSKFIFGKDYSNIVGLPIGEKAIVIATAHYKNKPYFAFKELIISKEQTIELHLKESSIEKIKETIYKF